MKNRSFLRRSIVAALTVLLLTIAAFAVDSPQAFYEEFYEHMAAQEKTFVISFDDDPAVLGVDTSSAKSMDDGVMHMINNMAIYAQEDHVALDVVKMNLNRMDAVYDGRNFVFSGDYLLDKEQLAWVDSQVVGLVSELFREGANDYEIVKAAYSYIATHFTYDTTLTKFTDYDGLTTGSMVCQGYALLMTKLLNQAGVDCRIITGWSQGVRHGWNIVKVDGLWYCLDVTWDAEESYANWDHFLMCREDFTDHIWDTEYLSADFLKMHPMAQKSYTVSQIDILIDGTLYSGLTMRKGKQLTLQTRITPMTLQPIHWATTNDAAVSITEDGMITSVSPGFAYITASVDDGGYIEGVLPVTAVDLTSCSPWADAELNALYLRQLYPAEICDSFQKGIRRDEFAHLAYLWMREHSPQPEACAIPGYEDLEANDYWFSIIFTTSRGIFNGTSEQTFSPSMTLTREQAAKVLFLLARQYGYQLDDSAVFPFPTDAEEISDWAEEYVDFVLATGLMKGLNDGRFDPKGTLTREQAAVMLERFCTKTLDQAA